MTLKIFYDEVYGRWVVMGNFFGLPDHLLRDTGWANRGNRLEAYGEAGSCPRLPLEVEAWLETEGYLL